MMTSVTVIGHFSGSSFLIFVSEAKVCQISPASFK